jgi:glycosyltransferase involved in cell wall biosynthesis
MIHRVDGPVSVYRGAVDQSIDDKINALNQEFADLTIFQSNYSCQKHLEMGYDFKNPTIIPNASDANIFKKNNRKPFVSDKKLRVLSSSWSMNPKKGFSTYQWLGENLNRDEYEYTFIGRSPVPIPHTKTIEALPSCGVADVLNEVDVYVTASEDECCSNSIIEALTCGVPVVCLDSGSNVELVKKGGLVFLHKEEILERLSELKFNYLKYQKAIEVHTIGEIADLYLNKILGIPK